jgi:hypothetical protein
MAGHTLFSGINLALNISLFNVHIKFLFHQLVSKSYLSVSLNQLSENPSDVIPLFDDIPFWRYDTSEISNGGNDGNFFYYTCS